MNVLLTGKSGFIGSTFYEEYKGKYNFISFSFQKENLDILDLSKIAVVVHLSALVHQMNGASKKEYFNINVDNTLHLAQKAKNSGVQHFIFMSTVKVYGEETVIPYTEDSVCNPQDEYGKSKLEAENRLKDLEDQHFKVSIIRTPIVYGTEVKANIKNLINLVKKVPILPFKNIDNRRSMIYIENLCAIIERIIALKKAGIFLAADDFPISTSELIKLISSALCKKVFLIKFPFFELIIKSIKPSWYKRLYLNLEINNTKTKEALGTTNLFTIEEGINRMINKEQNSARKE